MEVEDSWSCDRLQDQIPLMLVMETDFWKEKKDNAEKHQVLVFVRDYGNTAFKRGCSISTAIY